MLPGFQAGRLVSLSFVSLTTGFVCLLRMN
jgi:hypothetical protein